MVQQKRMAPIFEKLNLKQQREILVINAPASFDSELATLVGVSVLRDAGKVKLVEFALAFVITQSEVERFAKVLVSKAQDDARLWFAYPKGTSRKYKCDFNRDTGWDAMRRAGFDTVRQVAIDQDWSALRFRRIEYIKSTGTRRSPK